jgi:ATP-dependent helicase/DNAse subunit B
VLAVNAVTLDELVQRLTPDVTTATPGQRLALLQLSPPILSNSRYLYDAISELKSSRVRPDELRAAGADLLAGILEDYDRALHRAGLSDPQDRYAIAASRVQEDAIVWLERFERVVLHALYDLTESEFMLVRSLIERLPDGGTVVLFNSTANVKPTQFAEWTWQRFVRDESLAEKTFPDFCRTSHPNRAVLEKLFVFDAHDPLPPDDSLRIIEAPSRYKEVEKIGGDIADLLAAGESPNDVAVVVRHIETYGEMLEDVFTRYGIPHRFETGVPLVRIPFIKYWLAVLDLVTSERSREALARVMSSVYFNPRLSPSVDIERALAGFGYIDRNHLRASALAARKNAPLTSEIQRFEKFLDELESSQEKVLTFLNRLQPAALAAERDRQAWRVLSEEISAVGAVFSDGVALSRSRSADRPFSFQDFRKLASDIAGMRTVDRLTESSTTPGVPRVRIIHPHSLGSREHKWIFAPGFNDGEFPGRSSSNPLLSDTTIEAINARIRPRRLMTARDRNRREPLYFFMILDSATRRVYLTYPNSTLEGDPIYPSVYIGEITRHYAESPVTRAVPGPPRAEGEWRSRIVEEWRRGTLTENRARDLVGDSIVSRANLESKGALRRARIGKGVLPLDTLWHPSELNSLSSCPFVFLARHRLRLRAAELPDFEVPAQEIGILAHTILKDFYLQPVPSSLEEAAKRMNEIIARRLSAADVNGQGPFSVFDPSLWKIRRRQLVSVLNRYVEFAVRDAVAGFETQPEYLDASLPESPLGGIRLAGKPDHVAVHRTGEMVDGIRIDDFKYSAASSSTAKQLKQSFQIPVYAYLAARALHAEPAVRIEGRYLLLRSPGNPVIALAIDDGVFEDVRARIDSLMQIVQEGRFEPRPADRQDCADCDYRRLCRLYGS